MTLSCLSLAMALALGQVSGVDPPAGDGTERPPQGQARLEDGSSPEDLTIPAGVPFMPSVGTAQPTVNGFFLDVALLSSVRARTLTSTDASTTWGSDLEVTPGVAFEVVGPAARLSAGYAPRLSVPFGVGSAELAVLNQATLTGSWRPGPTWTLQANGIALVGDYSQLVPASSPGGAGPTPPVLNPVRSFLTYPYLAIDALLRADGVLSARTRLRLAGGYFDVGGTGEVGQANQPRTWGPQGEVAFAWDATRTATLETTLQGQGYWLVGGVYVTLTSLTEGWTQAWSSQVSTTLALGAGYSNRDVESRTAAGHVVPVARAGIAYTSDVRRTLTASFDAALTPYFDAYASIPYQRVTFAGALDWRPSDAWRLGMSLSAAIAPYTLRVPESYGTAGISASYAPLQFLIITAGGFSQSQFEGATVSGGAFRQWTGYLSIALRDRLPL